MFIQIWHDDRTEVGMQIEHFFMKSIQYLSTCLQNVAEHLSYFYAKV